MKGLFIGFVLGIVASGAAITAALQFRTIVPAATLADPVPSTPSTPAPVAADHPTPPSATSVEDAASGLQGSMTSLLNAIRWTFNETADPITDRKRWTVIGIAEERGHIFSVGCDEDPRANAGRLYFASMFDGFSEAYSTSSVRITMRIDRDPPATTIWQGSGTGLVTYHGVGGLSSSLLPTIEAISKSEEVWLRAVDGNRNRDFHIRADGFRPQIEKLLAACGYALSTQ